MSNFDIDRARLVAVAVVALLAGCSRSTAAGHGSSSEAEAPRPRYGAVMEEVGRRFERAGRAAAAGRFELADFEVGEIGELFEEDLPRAEPPKEGNAAALPGMADAFRTSAPTAMRLALASRDRAAFATAFEQAAGQCNACHRAAGHGFIEIPTTPGDGVPRLDPVPSAAATR